MRRAKRARCVLGLLFIVGILFVCLSQAGNAANAILDKIEIEVTSQHQIPVGTAVVGDAVKILAVLRPKVDGTAVEEELAVRFFFENRSTRETGLIGQASIPGLRGVKGEFRKAAVEWDPANMEPGYYNILAVGEFETSVSEDETTLKVLQEGKYFQFILNSRGVPVADKQGNVVMSQYLMGDEVARMPSGDFSKLSYRLSREKRFYIVNLGTENIASGDTFNLKCEYKTEHKDTFEELVEGCTVLGLAPGSIGPGEEGQLRLFLQFPFDFEGVRVGEPKKIQLRIQATDQEDVTSPTSPPVYLPSTDESLTVYSWVDLWTFPEPAGASFGNTGTDVTLSPVVVPTWTTYREGKDLVTNGELVVFHVETTQTEPKSLLYSHAIAVNKVINYYIKKQYSRWTDEEGEVVAWKPPDPAAEILAFTAVKDSQGVILLYIATHDGWVYGLRDNAAKNPLVPDNFETIWSQPDQIPIPSEDAEDFILHQPDVVTDADGNPVFVVFSTDVGLFAFDAYSGDLRWKITDSDKIPVTQPPIHFTDDDIWFASEERVYHFADPGVGGIPRPQEAERAAVTAPIALQTFTDTATDVAVLAEEGTLIVKDPYLLKPAEVSVCSRCKITGLSITGDSQATVKIYPTSDDGIDLVEYSNGVYKLREYTSVDCPFRPSYDGDPSGSPATLVGIDGKVSAFVTTASGELRAYDGELCKRLEVVLWPRRVQPIGEKDTFVKFYFDTASALTPPVVGVLKDPDNGEHLLEVLFFGSEDGRLYALDLTRRGREQYWSFE